MPDRYKLDPREVLLVEREELGGRNPMLLAKAPFPLRDGDPARCVDGDAGRLLVQVDGGRRIREGDLAVFSWRREVSDNQGRPNGDLLTFRAATAADVVANRRLACRTGPG